MTKKNYFLKENFLCISISRVKLNAQNKRKTYKKRPAKLMLQVFFVHNCLQKSKKMDRKLIAKAICLKSVGLLFRCLLRC